MVLKFISMFKKLFFSLFKRFFLRKYYIVFFIPFFMGRMRNSGRIHQRKAFEDLLDEVSKPLGNFSSVPLSLEDFQILREWASEYKIFIEVHLSGHTMIGSHFHVSPPRRYKHGRIHYLVNVTTL